MKIHHLAIYMPIFALTAVGVEHAGLSKGGSNFAFTSSCKMSRTVVRDFFFQTARKQDHLAPEAPEAPMVAVRGPNGKLQLSKLKEDSDFWRLGWQGTPPSPNLVHEWYRAPYKTSYICFGLHDNTGLTLEKLLGPFPVRKDRLPQPDGYVPLTFRISYPALSKSNDRALILVAEQSAGIGGRVRLVALDRSPYGWRISGVRVLSVS